MTRVQRAIAFLRSKGWRVDGLYYAVSPEGHGFWFSAAEIVRKSQECGWREEGGPNVG